MCNQLHFNDDYAGDIKQARDIQYIGYIYGDKLPHLHLRGFGLVV